VEANEAMRRIFWRHRWLLVALVLIPVAAVAAFRLTAPVKYAATATIQAQSTPPQADTEAAAIMSRVSAVATSPSIVQAAMQAINAGGDAPTVARHEVAVSSLGSSAIVTVTVTDSSRLFALRVARSLAAQIVSALNGLGTQSSQQIAALDRQRAQLNTARNLLLRQLDGAQARGQQGTSAGVQSLIAQLNAVEAQLSANLTSVQQVLANSTVNQGAAIISAPAAATTVSRHVASDAALAGLLGLVVGVLIATIRELSRPTVAEPAGAARELSLVLLGRARLANGMTADMDDDLPMRLSLAARRLGARTLVLTGPVDAEQLTTLAADIDANLPAVVIDPHGADGHGPSREWGTRVLPARVASGGANAKRPIGSSATISPHILGHSPAGAEVSVIALPALTLQAQPEDPALVLVLPRFAPHAALEQAVDLGVTTGWPLLGVIGLRPGAGRRR
jgi:capsular polysaccharide biosynthesis protein